MKEENREPLLENEMVPQEVLKNRLAEASRKHANQIDGLRQEMKDMLATQAASQVAAAPISTNNEGTFASSPNSISMTPEQFQSSYLEARRIEKEQDAAQQQKEMMEHQQSQQVKAQKDALNAIKTGMQNDPELEELVNKKGADVPADVAGMLAGFSSEDIPAIMKKILGSSDSSSKIKNASNFSAYEREALVKELAKEAWSDRLSSTLPSQGEPKIFTEDGKGTSSKDISKMNSKQLRKYYKETGYYR